MVSQAHPDKETGSSFFFLPCQAPETFYLFLLSLVSVPHNIFLFPPSFQLQNILGCSGQLLSNSLSSSKVRTNRGFPTRMVYLNYITCLRYPILVRNPRNGLGTKWRTRLLQLTLMIQTTCVHRMHICKICSLNLGEA